MGITYVCANACAEHEKNRLVHLCTIRSRLPEPNTRVCIVQRVLQRNTFLTTTVYNMLARVILPIVF